jgi:hypothetical protein
LLLDLNSSAACLDRALQFANDLYNAFESAGYPVAMAATNAELRRSSIDEREKAAVPRQGYHYGGLWSPQRPTVVYIGSVPIGLAIIEMSENVLLRYVGGKYIRDADYVPPVRGYAQDHTWTTREDIPSGRLRLVAYSPCGRVSWTIQWQEAGGKSLSPMVADIVRDVARAIPELVEKQEEAARQAEIAHQKWLADMERYRRVEDQKRVEQSVKESREQLEQVILQWTNVMSVEKFFAGIEQRAAALPEDDAAPVLERLALARQSLGSQDPLDFFREWRAPGERYETKYPGG